MSMQLIAVGKRMPGWVNPVFNEYNRRLPPDYRLDLIEVSSANRTRSHDEGAALQKEAGAIQKSLPVRAFIILLDERGKHYSSVGLAADLEKWRNTGRNICFIIGGANGVDKSLQKQADVIWSLSSLTFPHAMVRVILCEQIYRAWSINRNHPYHRE